MWEDIVGGALDIDLLLAQGDAAETAMNEWLLLGGSDDSFSSFVDGNQSDSSLDVDPIKTLTEAGAILDELEQHMCEKK